MFHKNEIMIEQDETEVPSEEVEVQFSFSDKKEYGERVEESMKNEKSDKKGSKMKKKKESSESRSRKKESSFHGKKMMKKLEKCC